MCIRRFPMCELCIMMLVVLVVWNSGRLPCGGGSAECGREDLPGVDQLRPQLEGEAGAGEKREGASRVHRRMQYLSCTHAHIGAEGVGAL